ncbi:hypothetical protein PVT67_04800 [Gallaecimonas kandeliae]|uniref:hypothetical protein n=1 Tax=Gallaecimonas kandeliae TaxID=3029055 RepID=UPI0026493720|nr:hypothetical protein [Gallaecimonas kandeliae]WKE66572.1 hypothetical protein PVT67_04800 [Gallaecimonas kandeliae]
MNALIKFLFFAGSRPGRRVTFLIEPSLNLTACMRKLIVIFNTMVKNGEKWSKKA